MDGQYMALWDFCNDDHSPCSGDKCSNYEDKLCGLHATATIMAAVAMVCEALTCIFMLGVALNYTHLCMTPAHKAKGMAQCCMFMQVVAAVLWAILIPLWGSAKAELPDLHCTYVSHVARDYECASNAKLEWKYEPSRCDHPGVNCALEWSMVLAGACSSSLLPLPWCQLGQLSWVHSALSNRWRRHRLWLRLGKVQAPVSP